MPPQAQATAGAGYWQQAQDTGAASPCGHASMPNPDLLTVCTHVALLVDEGVQTDLPLPPLPSLPPPHLRPPPAHWQGTQGKHLAAHLAATPARLCACARRGVRGGRHQGPRHGGDRQGGDGQGGDRQGGRQDGYAGKQGVPALLRKQAGPARNERLAGSVGRGDYTPGAGHRVSRPWCRRGQAREAQAHMRWFKDALPPLFLQGQYARGTGSVGHSVGEGRALVHTWICEGVAVRERASGV